MRQKSVKADAPKRYRLMCPLAYKIAKPVYNDHSVTASGRASVNAMQSKTSPGPDMLLRLARIKHRRPSGTRHCFKPIHFRPQVIPACFVTRAMKARKGKVPSQSRTPPALYHRDIITRQARQCSNIAEISNWCSYLSILSIQYRHNSNTRTLFDINIIV